MSWISLGPHSEACCWTAPQIYATRFYMTRGVIPFLEQGASRNKSQCIMTCADQLQSAIYGTSVWVSEELAAASIRDEMLWSPYADLACGLSYFISVPLILRGQLFWHPPDVLVHSIIISSKWLMIVFGRSPEAVIGLVIRDSPALSTWSIGSSGDRVWSQARTAHIYNRLSISGRYNFLANKTHVDERSKVARMVLRLW